MEGVKVSKQGVTGSQAHYWSFAKDSLTESIIVVQDPLVEENRPVSYDEFLV
jgi:hypothetical protein